MTDKQTKDQVLDAKAQALIARSKATPDISHLGMKSMVVTPHKAKATTERATMPQTRILGAQHPVDFAKDVNNFVTDCSYTSDRKKITQAEIIELAFYTLRKKQTGQPIPTWITPLSKPKA